MKVRRNVKLLIKPPKYCEKNVAYKSDDYNDDSDDYNDDYWADHTYIIMKLLRNNISLLRYEKMLWYYPIFVLIKFLELPCIHASKEEFYLLEV